MKPSTDKSPQEPAGASVRKTPWRRWLTAGGMVVAIFVVAGLIGSVVRAHKETQLAPPEGATGASALAVPQWGHAAVTLTVYEDMRDPATLAFENTYGATLRQLVASGVANVYYRETTGVDKAQGGSGSLQAGNALGCALDAKKFADYRAVLLNNQPTESDDAFGSDSHLITLAKKVKELDTDVFRACVDNGDHKVWVQDSNKAFTASNFGPGPVLTMLVDQTNTNEAQAQAIISSTLTLTPKQLQDRVLAAAVQATPTSADLPSVAVTNGATPTPAAAPTTPAPSLSASAKPAKAKKKPTASASPSLH
ncbi:DsbA family protein [Streptacidiphilus jiangxiensis]|uniref:Thioredoxin n=1 Tax=Streptacidiphilus jiangxiensis TaxID=235985 RepID=A0A1H7KZW7_STRJI|nr:thioredoxin domain-containing protein [Streptacidiphilus jiangxiensis]SEK92006.1 Thioredoxin [Streptacidiphilus jiangxiensis]